MPITIKQHLLKVKDGNTYVGIDALAETSTQEHVTAINDAGTAQMAAITAKGVETRATIPDNYTALSDEVQDLKSALNTTASLTGIKWSNGYYNTNNVWQDNLYWKLSNDIPCNAGDTFVYHGNSSQTNRRVVVFWDRDRNVVSGLSNLGTDFTDVTVTVPANAEYMRILGYVDTLYKTYIIYGGNAGQSPFKANRVRIIANENDIASIKTNFDYLSGIGMHFGYINKYGKITTPSETRKYTDFFFVPGGCTIRYKGESGHASVNGISFFDSNGAYISGNCNGGTNGTWITVTVPENASLARISTHTDISYAVAFEVTGGNIFNAVSNKLRADCVAYVSGTSGSDTSAADGTKELPYASIGYAISQGFRKICATPGRYNENISLSGGEFELIPWVDGQTFSDAYRPKIKLIKGTKLTVSATSSTGIYQASYTAASGTNMYKVFVGKTVSPTSQGSLATEYNALLVEDMPDVGTSTKAAFPYQRQLYMPVLTETELSAEGTFWYDGTNNLVKFHAYDNTVAGEYYIPDDDAADGLKLEKMQKVHLEDVKVLGCYDSCIAVLNCDDATINACEFGYCAKGMGLRSDYANARVSDCHAYAISVDGFNLHGYGYSEIVDCTAFYCGDDGISHHQGCSGFVDGGEWAYCGSGGITPSFGCQVDVLNAYAHHNNIGIQWLGQDTNSRRTKMTNCLSIDNTTDVYVLWYVVTAWNCVFRTKDSQYSGLRSKLTEYGTITPD